MTEESSLSVTVLSYTRSYSHIMAHAPPLAPTALCTVDPLENAAPFVALCRRFDGILRASRETVVTFDSGWEIQSCAPYLDRFKRLHHVN
jgi:hypothetical protein